METKSSVNIFVSCHKDCDSYNNKSIIPIQVGCALSNQRFDGMQWDDIGDNISIKNKSYCEVTAQYWAWKNVDSEYYGFFHYRRYLSLNSKKSNNCYININDLSELDNYGYNHDDIEKIIKKYDLIIPIKDKLDKSNYELYDDNHNIQDLDTVLSIINELNPEMYDLAKEYIHSKEGYYCNMYIMKKEIFHAYCDWLFNIMSLFESKVDVEKYNTAQYRVHGYLAERLCGIYLEWLRHTKKYKIKEEHIINVANTDKSMLEPVFEKTDCALVLAANDYFSPYLSTLIQSIIENSKESKNYDLIVLSTDISNKNKDKILSQVLNHSNISVRFVNALPVLKKYSDSLPVHGHFRIETYYRFLIQDILPHYSKAVYLDSDMIVLDDVSNLYAVEIKDRSIAACKDADTAGLYNGYEPNKKYYMDNILKITEPYNYFQAGTLILNLDKIRSNNKTSEILKFASSYHWDLLDQDVLNYYYQNDVSYIPMKWNCMVDMFGFRINKIISLAPYELVNRYMEARSNPSIIHYAGPEKPWFSPLMDFASYFWKYARHTPFYIEMLIKLKHVDD